MPSQQHRRLIAPQRSSSSRGRRSGSRTPGPASATSCSRSPPENTTRVEAWKGVGVGVGCCLRWSVEVDSVAAPYDSHVHHRSGSFSVESRRKTILQTKYCRLIRAPLSFVYAASDLGAKEERPVDGSGASSSNKKATVTTTRQHSQLRSRLSPPQQPPSNGSKDGRARPIIRAASTRMVLYPNEDQP